MLYQLKLPDETLRALTQAVRVQMALLRYAATAGTLIPAGCEMAIDADPGLAGRGAAVAQWVWKSKNRRQRLETFHAEGAQAEKLAWVGALDAEVTALLDGTPASLTLVDDTVPWQKAAGEFLRQFYEDLGSDGGLPAAVVGRAESFSRHDFLRAFSAANDGMYVCASCDEARIGTRTKGRLRTDIDHFFPKSVYPHLSVHPYNLVPICHSCNSYTKGTVDPLLDGGARCLPADLVLPYRSEGLATHAYLAVDLKAWRNTALRRRRSRKARGPFAFKPRKPQGASDGQIRGVARVADIPARWNEAEVVHEIGETAFRRLSQFLRAQSEALDDPQQLLDKLDEFLGVLDSENLRRDPLTFPIQWLLAHLADGARRQPGKSALVQEIRDWIPVPAAHAEHQKRGADLRTVLKG